MKKDRRLLIGLALTAFTGLLFFLVFSLDSTMTWIQGSEEVRVTFSNVQGLRSDDPVYFHGVPCGRVAGVRFHPQEPSASQPGIAVAAPAGTEATPALGMRVMLSLSLPKEVRDYLRTGSKASIEKTLTGITVVNIEQGDGDPLRDGETLVGVEAAGLSEITEQLHESSGKITAVLEDVQKIVSDCRTEGFVQEILGSIRNASAQGKDVVDSIQEILEENRQSFRELARNGVTVTERIDAVLERVDGVVREVDGVVEGVPGLLQEADGAVREAGVVFRDTKKWLREIRPHVDSTAEDIARTADDLATLSTDIRHRPWRLLHAPGKDEVRELELFQTATQYSRSATEVRRAIDRLSQLLAGAEDDPQLADALGDVFKTLDARLSRHTAFEEELWNRMMREGD